MIEGNNANRNGNIKGQRTKRHIVTILRAIRRAACLQHPSSSSTTEDDKLEVINLSKLRAQIEMTCEAIVTVVTDAFAECEELYIETSKRRAVDGSSADEEEDEDDYPMHEVKVCGRQSIDEQLRKINVIRSIIDDSSPWFEGVFGGRQTTANSQKEDVLKVIETYEQAMTCLWRLGDETEIDNETDEEDNWLESATKCKLEADEVWEKLITRRTDLARKLPRPTQEVEIHCYSEEKKIEDGGESLEYATFDGEEGGGGDAIVGGVSRPVTTVYAGTAGKPKRKKGGAELTIERSEKREEDGRRNADTSKMLRELHGRLGTLRNITKNSAEGDVGVREKEVVVVVDEETDKELAEEEENEKAMKSKARESSDNAAVQFILPSIFSELKVGIEGIGGRGECVVIGEDDD
jgi:hypothetical protein